MSCVDDRICNEQASRNGRQLTDASLAINNRAFIARLAPLSFPQLIRMPTHQPSCPRCHDNLFVRRERILSGRRVTNAFYCGRCNHDWSVESPTYTPERRREGERRKRRLERLVSQLAKAAPAALREKANRRKVG
jgi:hypothetical protein